jgi:hypothetical protein
MLMRLGPTSPYPMRAGDKWGFVESQNADEAAYVMFGAFATPAAPNCPPTRTAGSSARIRPKRKLPRPEVWGILKAFAHVGQNSASPDVKSGVCEMAIPQGKPKPYRGAGGKAARGPGLTTSASHH